MVCLYCAFKIEIYIESLLINCQLIPGISGSDCIIIEFISSQKKDESILNCEFSIVGSLQKWLGLCTAENIKELSELNTFKHSKTTVLVW